MIIALAYLNLYLGIFSTILQISIVMLNLIIFIISKRELKKELISSHENLGKTTNILH